MFEVPYEWPHAWISSCWLCEKLRESIPTDFGKGWRLCVFSSPAIEPVEDKEFMPSRSGGYAWIQPNLNKKELNIDLSVLVLRAKHRGWTACQAKSLASAVFKPQLVMKYCNYKMINSWLAFCQSRNRECVIHDPVGNLLVLDCISLEVIVAPETCKYVALSYVWAKVPISSSLASQESKTRRSVHFTPTVMDAISVTLQLGYQYLWVDRYCVDQKDPVLREVQIDNMDQVYSQASLTIIAATGDENTGLYGVRVPRKMTDSYDTGMTLVHWVSPSAEQVSQESDWAQRAWTFQEELLSRRRLYFTEYQVDYLCREISCCESEVAQNI
jgi:hypothetical protein